MMIKREKLRILDKKALMVIQLHRTVVDVACNSLSEGDNLYFVWKGAVVESRSLLICSSDFGLFCGAT